MNEINLGDIFNPNKNFPLAFGRISIIKMLVYGRVINIGAFEGKMFGDKVTNVDLYDFGAPNLTIADAKTLPFKNKEFDCAVLSEVLEHVDDPKQVLQEAMRVADSVVISVPNEHEFSKDQKPFTNVGPGHTPDGSGGHVRFYDEKTLFELFKEVNFPVIYYTKINMSGWSTLIAFGTSLKFGMIGHRTMAGRSEPKKFGQMSNLSICENIAIIPTRNVDMAMEATVYPSIHLDTFSYCNAKCAFCAYPKMTRVKGKMDMALFKKIVDEIASWNRPIEISPVHFGEFFMNPDWFQILQYMDEKLPHCKVSIPTNGSAFDDDMINKLATIKNLHYVNFSLYAYEISTYKSLMGLSEKDYKRVEYAFTKLREKRPDVQIVMGATFNSLFISPIELSKLDKKYGNLVHAHDITLNKTHGFNRSFQTDEPCSELFLCLIVLWDGRVCCCCADPNGELEVGNVNKNTIIEIWNGPPLNTYRRLHNEGNRNKISLCESCTCTKMNPGRKKL